MTTELRRGAPDMYRDGNMSLIGKNCYKQYGRLDMVLANHL